MKTGKRRGRFDRAGRAGAHAGARRRSAALAWFAMAASMAAAIAWLPQSAMAEPFAWDGNWQRMDASGNAPSTLAVQSVTATGMSFALEAAAGANTGELTGKAAFSAGGDGTAVQDVAVFKGTSADDNQCELTFRRAGARLEIQQNASDCGAGNGVRYAGTYVSGNVDPSPKPTLLSRGVFETQAQDDAFRKLVGRDYDSFVSTADVVDAEKGLADGHDARVVNMFVRGVACNTKAVVIVSPKGKLWAAVWEAMTRPDVVQMRYYTNVSADRDAMPKPILDQQAGCPGDRVVVRVPG